MKPRLIGSVDRRSSAKRWIRYWYALLFVYVAAVLGSVYIRHNLADEYERAVVRSQEWTEKFRRYARLGRLMMGVDGLDSQAPTQEQLTKTATQIQEVQSEFERVFLGEEKEFLKRSNEEQAQLMLKDLELVKKGMDELIENTAKLRAQEEVSARKQNLSTVSDCFHKVIKSFSRLRSRVSGVERESFQEQIDAVHMLERVEYAIGFLLFLLVGGVTYYGNRLDLHAKLFLKEKALLLQQVEAADGKYRALFENASDGIFQLDSQGRFMMANPALALMCGYSSPEEFMQAITDVGSQFYADPAFWPQFLEDVANERASSTCETEVKSRGGNRIWVEQNLHAVEEVPGQIAYFEGTVKNITEQKWAEVRRTLEYLLPRIVAESASVEEAQEGVLQTLCKILGWEMGVSWKVGAGKLVLSHLFKAGELARGDAPALGTEIPLGGGFYENVLTAGEVFSSKLDRLELSEDTKALASQMVSGGLPDLLHALENSLGRIVSLPVRVNGNASYLLNFFSAEAYLRTSELLILLTAVNAQLGSLFERKRGEEALRESEALKAAIFESSLDSMVTFDEEGIITDFNPAAERTFGYTREIAMGLNIGRIISAGSFREICSAEDPGANRLRGGGAFEEARQGEDRPEMILGRRLELTALRADRSEFPVEMSVSQISHNSSKSFYTAYIREISDRKRAERVRLELAAVVEASSDAIIGLTPDGNIVSWNNGAAEMFGYGAREVLGRHVFMLVPPDRLEESTRNLQALRSGQRHANYTTVRLRKGGKRFDVSLTESPIRNSSGAVSGISLIARDITENQLLQEQLLQAQKMEAVGALAGGIAHDFNNILTAILGYCDLTLRQVKDEVPFHKNLLGIKSSAEFAASLTHQLLAFSRRQTLELSVFPVNDSVARIQKLLQRLIGENITVITSLSPAAGRIRADRGQMEQVIMNLAVNARDAMPKGGILTLDTSNVNVEEGDNPFGVPPGEYVKLAVSDTGHGMTDEVREHLFEPFFTTKDKGKGTGLGLATCYGIIKQIGGHILVDSVLGEGSTFSLYFPLVADTEASPKAPTRKSSPLPKGNETILLVEDEDTVRQLSVDVLRRLGYTVLAAADSDSARSIIESRGGAVDLLLSDVVLPNSSGKELADWVSSLYKETRVLLMSGYLEDAILKNYKVGPEDDFLQKPFSPTALAEKVRAVLDAPVKAKA